MLVSGLQNSAVSAQFRSSFQFPMLSSAWIAVMYSLRQHEANDDPRISEVYLSEGRDMKRQSFHRLSCRKCIRKQVGEGNEVHSLRPVGGVN